jgi:hypothetical protein
MVNVIAGFPLACLLIFPIQDAWKRLAPLAHESVILNQTNSSIPPNPTYTQIPDVLDTFDIAGRMLRLQRNIL